MLDPHVQRFLKLLNAGHPVSVADAGVSARREQLAALMKFAGPEIAMGRVEDRLLDAVAGGLAVRIYTPTRSADTMPGLVYFHGGGLVAGSIATHDSIARGLADAGACRVVSVEYRLGPEQRFPAALDDAVAAVRHVARHAARFGIDCERLGICGDSAGATLAAAACQALCREGGVPLALQLLICPILAYGRSEASRRELAGSFLVNQAILDHDLQHYLPPGADLDDPRISPLAAAELSGQPKTLIHTAEYDPLRHEAQAYCDRLRSARTDVSYTCHPGMIHLFYGLGAVIPYVRTAFERMGGEIRAAFG